MNNLTYQGAALALSLTLVACGDDGVATTEQSTGSSTEAQETTTGEPPTTGPTTDPTTPTTGPTTTTEPSTTTGPTTTNTTPATTETDTSATDTSTTDTGDTDDSTSTGVDPVCGDGNVDVGEQCDDGPDNGDMNACKSDCMLAICGDGLVGPGEGCDDGPDNGDMNACKSDCTPNFCGDALVGPGEGCDDGNMDDADECTNACALATCGDGVVSVSEACDDGNAEETDLCTNACTEATCGDAIVQPIVGETCDEGLDNNDQGDCTGSCNPGVCGDGLVHDQGSGTEQCDNGNDNGPGQLCNATCALNVCGDGDKGPGEACDDGDLEPGDGCNATCELEVCGDNKVDLGEACDDGKDGDQDDGCTDLCTVPICGDNFLQPSLGETCDAGPNNSNTGACTLGCKVAACGDNFVQAGVEQCDDGPNNADTKACKADCTDNVCGDGKVEAGVEECDDGNQVDNDACSNVCKAAACNDGIKNGTETEIDCGGPGCAICPTVILLAGGNTGPNGNLGGTFTQGTGWTLKPLNGVTVEGVAVAMTSTNVGVGLTRFTQINNPQDNQLHYATWTNGVWSTLSQVSNFTTRGWPAISSAGVTAQALFHGDDFKHYYTAFSNGAWTPAEPTGSFGPIAGDIAALGANAATFFNDGANNNRIASRDRQNGVWQAPVLYAQQVNINIPPVLIPMNGGAAEVMGFWPWNQLGPVRWARRTNGVWGGAADVPMVLTNGRVDAAAAPGGNAAMVYRGTDDKFHAMAFVAAINSWQGPSNIPGNPTITGTPAITQGVGGFVAEAVYISNGQVWHSRFNANFVWSAPVLVGGADIRSVALARSN